MTEGERSVSGPARSTRVDRKVFSEFPVDRELPMPNLLDVQLASFKSCLGTGSSDDGTASGMDDIFKRFFPVAGVERLSIGQHGGGYQKKNDTR